MESKVDFEQEEDGRWIAEVPSLPGVMAYGSTREDAQARAEALAHDVVQEQSPN
jgi:predicted RNase H-like HicB family nuclease